MVCSFENSHICLWHSTQVAPDLLAASARQKCKSAGATVCNARADKRKGWRTAAYHLIVLPIQRLCERQKLCDVVRKCHKQDRPKESTGKIIQKKFPSNLKADLSSDFETEHQVSPLPK